MKRRSRAGGEPIKGRRGETSEPKRGNAPKAATRLNAPHSEKETEVGRLARELNEALERQVATSEVLNVISSSSGELEPVFNAILQNAARICQAQFGTLNLYDGTAYRTVALHNAPRHFARTRLGETFRPHPESGLAHVARNKQIVQIDDIRMRQPYIEGDKTVVELADIAGARTLLIVPMLDKEKLVGTVSIYHREVSPFTDKQIELVQNFAAQAVIAIENARLLNELRQRTSDLTERTADLTEALEQQTATSEVLQVISSSPGDLESVFAAMLENAARICGASFGNIFSWDGDALRLIATHNTPSAFAEYRRRQPLPLKPNLPFARMVATKALVHCADAAALPAYVEQHDPEVTAAVELGNIHTFVAVPMLKEDKLIGALIVYRQEVRPFTDKQIELVKNFANQAVIAIENARLLNELRERTTDLTEALEQQTATSNVLQVISSSPGNLEPVFATMLENAVRLCDAKFGSINSWDGEALHLVGTYNVPPAFAEFRKRTPFRPGPENPISQMLMTRTIIHFHNLATEQGYIDRNPTFVAAVELGGVRTFLAVPMMKENELIGVVIVYRQEVRPFSDKQIEVAKSFAAQAVIAIENARLLNELREALERQTATAEVLGVISRSKFELQPVLQSVLDTAARLCRAEQAQIRRLEGGCYRLDAVSGHGIVPAYLEIERRIVVAPGPGTVVGRAAMNREVVRIEDAWTDPLYEKKEDAKVGGVRSMIGVPLMREGEPIGVLALARTRVEPFVEREIELVKTFADQSVIAIENARLLNELRERTDQLQVQSKELADLNQQLEQRVADQVGEIERMSRLRRFLPPQVADLIVASGSEQQLESHRREITALFCDLRGFTGFTESADAEDVMALLRDYHAAIGEIIIKYNGTLERYAGDGVMVIFNDPVPVENPALQAVLMALEVREAIGALTERWRRWGHDLGFGIGIAHGFATLGTIGFEGRFDYAAIGTVSNVASRLCDEAKPGQILISARVLTKVEQAVKVEPVGEFELKGIRRPLAAYNVIGASS